MDNKHILNYRQGTAAAIPRNRIVIFGATDIDVVLATGNTAPLIGVTTELASATLGERLDVNHGGFERIEAGATFSRGTKLTSDATGRAVAWAAGNTSIGFALETCATVGQRVLCKVIPS